MTSNRAESDLGSGSGSCFPGLATSLRAMVAAAGENQVLTVAAGTAADMLGCSFAEGVLDTGVRVSAGVPGGGSSTQAPIRIGTDPIGFLRAEGSGDAPERLQHLADLVGPVIASHRLSDSLRREVRHTREALDKVRADESARDRFLAMLSHEFRTPLTSIRSLAEVLFTSEEEPETVKDYVSIIHEESVRLTRLVNRLLDLDRLRDGHMDWDFQPGDPRAAIEAARRSVIAYAAERRVTIDVDVAPSLRTFPFDHDRIVQVLVNLLMNAVRFSPEGEAVTLSASESRAGIRFTVSDRGPGIRLEDRELIFERFRTTGDRAGQKGIGLGLAISREIASAHGGRLFVEPAEGPGARLTLQL